VAKSAIPVDVDRILQLEKPRFHKRESFADASGISLRTLQDVLKHGEATWNSLHGIARALGVRAEELQLRGADEAPPGLRQHLISFDSFIEERTRNFVGRDVIFDEIDRFVSDDGTRSGYFLIRGLPGMGKSAFMAEFVRRNKPIHHFNIGLQGINSPSQFLGNICAQMIQRFNLPYDTLPDNFDRGAVFLNRILSEVSALATADDPLAIVIDALDEVHQTGTSSIANPLFLPFDLPPNVYVIMTCRHSEDVSFQVSNIHETELSPDSDENDDDIREYLATWLPRSSIKEWISSQGFDRGKFVGSLLERSEGNFMYLHHVLPAIERGDFTEGTVDELPHGLRAYYRRHWAKMRNVDTTTFEQMYQPVVCVLAAVQRPVLVEQVVEWTQLGISQVQSALEDWREFLYVERSDNNRDQYRVYHTAFRDFLQEEVDSGLKTYHAMIALSALRRVRREH